MRTPLPKKGTPGSKPGDHRDELRPGAVYECAVSGGDCIELEVVTLVGDRMSGCADSEGGFTFAGKTGTFTGSKGGVSESNGEGSAVKVVAGDSDGLLGDPSEGGMGHILDSLNVENTRKRAVAGGVGMLTVSDVDCWVIRMDLTRTDFATSGVKTKRLDGCVGKGQTECEFLGTSL